MSYQETKLKIDSLKEKVAAHGKLTDEQLKKINYKFRLEWNYTSNSMEGNTLTIDETRSVMVGNIDVHQKPYKHVAEMKGHDEVISEILKVGKGELRLSETRIKQIHTSIMYEEADGLKDLVGNWKKQNNHVINRKGEKFDFMDWELIPDKIHDLLNRTNAAIDALQQGKRKDVRHPLDIAFDFHFEYLTIHPFYDGNGRTARILTNLILISFGYPPFWITEKEKDTYYAYLTDIQGYGGDRKLLDAFMADLVLRSQQLVVDVIEGKDIEDEDDLDKEIALLKVSFENLPSLRSIDILKLIYKKIKNEVLQDTLKTLNKFQDFFYEVKTFEMLDGKQNILNFPIIELKEALLFPMNFTGRQIDVDDFFKEIVFTNVLSKLKRGAKQLEARTEMFIKFEKFQYIFYLNVNGTQLFFKEYKYHESISSNDLKEMQKELKKYFLFLLKDQLN
jgi:Fic family protein